jgi:hypothetical protein
MYRQWPRPVALTWTISRVLVAEWMILLLLLMPTILPMSKNT